MSVGVELNAFVDAWNSRLEILATEMTKSESEIVLIDMNRDFGDDDLDDGHDKVRRDVAGKRKPHAIRDHCGIPG